VEMIPYILIGCDGAYLAYISDCFIMLNVIMSIARILVGPVHHILSNISMLRVHRLLTVISLT